MNKFEFMLTKSSQRNHFALGKESFLLCKKFQWPTKLFCLPQKSLGVRRTFLSKKANLLKQITLVPEAILCKTKLASWKSCFLLKQIVITIWLLPKMSNRSTNKESYIYEQ